MFLNETFLEPNVCDFLFNVNCFDIFRRDRPQMAYVDAEIKVKRTDMERSDMEIIWLEVCLFKSYRSLLIAGVYRPPSFSSEKTNIVMDHLILIAAGKVHSTNIVILRD